VVIGVVAYKVSIKAIPVADTTAEDWLKNPTRTFWKVSSALLEGRSPPISDLVKRRTILERRERFLPR